MDIGIQRDWILPWSSKSSQRDNNGATHNSQWDPAIRNTEGWMLLGPFPMRPMNCFMGR